MALVSYRQFKGEIPAVEPHLLPTGFAQLAENCQFSRGSLQSMKGGTPLGTMLSAPVKGIYTETGLSFYTWPTETLTFRTPIVDDSFNRMYFLVLSEGVFKVASTLSMAFNGPTPLAGNSYRTGVPRPTVAPVLQLLDRTTLPDYPAATVTFDVWYESGSKAYDQVTGAGYSTVAAFKQYTINKPARGAETPEDATIVVRMKVRSDGTDVVNTLVRPSSTTRISSLPGSQEISLADGATLSLNIAWGPEETRAYVYVNENTWNEESAPSPASKASPTYLQDVRITVGASDFTGYRPFQRHRIYRTYGSVASYVGAETTGASPIYIDASRAPSAVGTSLQSTEWDPAPDGLQGAAYMPGGIFAVFKGNALYVSEPYRPHAFPYIFTFSASIRGICAAQQSLVVTTADGLYILAGSAPANAQVIKVSTPQPGVAQRSMVNIDGGVTYASGDGFVLVDGSSASMATSQKLFGRSKWREMYGSIIGDASMRFSFHDGYLVASSNTAATGFTLRFDEDVGSLSRQKQRMDSTFLLPVEDALYYSEGSTLYRYQAGSDLAFDWHGRDEVFPGYVTFGAGFLRGDPMTLKLYMDGELVVDMPIQQGYFRLPSALPRCLRLSVRLQGAGVVKELCLGRTMAELQIG